MTNVTFHAEKERSTLLDRNDPDKRGCWGEGGECPCGVIR
jgi:hypothetical protein